MPGLTTQKFDQTPPRKFLRHQEWLPDSIFDYDEYQSNKEEDRRLFYVGLTRAQNIFT
jgi:superfamily I DNA/RNA helicase